MSRTPRVKEECSIEDRVTGHEQLLAGWVVQSNHFGGCSAQRAESRSETSSGAGWPPERCDTVVLYSNLAPISSGVRTVLGRYVVLLSS